VHYIGAMMSSHVGVEVREAVQGAIAALGVHEGSAEVAGAVFDLKSRLEAVERHMAEHREMTVWGAAGHSGMRQRQGGLSSDDRSTATLTREASSDDTAGGINDQLIALGRQKLMDDLPADLVRANQRSAQMAEEFDRLRRENAAKLNRARRRSGSPRRRVGLWVILVLTGGALAYAGNDIAGFDGRRPRGFVGRHVAAWAASTEWARPLERVIEWRANASLEGRLERAIEPHEEVWSGVGAPTPDGVADAFADLDRAYHELDGEVELEGSREELRLAYANALEAEAGGNHGVCAGSNMRLVHSIRAWVEGYVAPRP
jgi:hypothetical protein